MKIPEGVTFHHPSGRVYRAGDEVDRDHERLLADHVKQVPPASQSRPVVTQEKSE